MNKNLNDIAIKYTLQYDEEGFAPAYSKFKQDLLAMLPEKEENISTIGTQMALNDFEAGWNAYADEVRKRLGVEDDTTR